MDLLVPSLGLEARVFYDRLGASSREEDIPVGGEVVLTPLAAGSAPASATFRPLDPVRVVLHADKSRVPVEVRVEIPSLAAWASVAGGDESDKEIDA